MKACMGGWCSQREQCPHYTAQATQPVERMCTPGMDGVLRAGRSHFSPTGDSKVMRLVRYFEANPDEALSTNDIATKFELTTNSARALLSDAVRQGLVSRVLVGGGQGHESMYAPINANGREG